MYCVRGGVRESARVELGWEGTYVCMHVCTYHFEDFERREWGMFGFDLRREWVATLLLRVHAESIRFLQIASSPFSD